MKKNLFFSLLLVCIFINSCKKETSNGSRTVTNRKLVAHGPIAPYVFNWETATYMPSAAGGNQLQMPWNSGTTAIDANIVSDYKSFEGWELVYNTFSPSVSLNDPNYTYFFALYNKYRGILRFYLWQPAAAIATSYVEHGLSLYGATTSNMLNYNLSSIISNANKVAFTMAQNQQINSAGGTWFAYEYEIAYDPNIPSTTFPNVGLTWNSKWINVSTITLNGTQNGEIKGTIGSQETSSFNFGNTVKGSVTLLGSAGYSAYLNNLSKFTGGGGNKAFASSVNNALNGLINGFLNGVFGGTTSTIKPIHLTMETKIKLDGSIVNNGSMVNMKLILPGQINSQTADGNIPKYNKTMGIFKLSNLPTVMYKEMDNNVEYEDPQYGGTINAIVKEETLALMPNSFQIIWNPDIINTSTTGASIQNIKTQVIKLLPENLNTTLNPNKFLLMYDYSQAAGSTNPGLISGTGLIEVVGTQYAACSLINSTTPLKVIHDSSMSGTGTAVVRISFEVKPNNGAPITTIVKTFDANLVYNNSL